MQLLLVILASALTYQSAGRDIYQGLSTWTREERREQRYDATGAYLSHSARVLLQQNETWNTGGEEENEQQEPQPTGANDAASASGGVSATPDSQDDFVNYYDFYTYYDYGEYYDATNGEGGEDIQPDEQLREDQPSNTTTDGASIQNIFGRSWIGLGQSSSPFLGFGPGGSVPPNVTGDVDDAG